MAIATADKLYVYNEALRIMESRGLTALTDAERRRYILDAAWGSNDEGVEYALGQADWNFATKVAEMTYDAMDTNTFGFQYFFAKPTDLIRLTSIASDEFFRSPLSALSYDDRNDQWHTDLTTFYVKYVSNDVAYGFDSTIWPMPFKKFLAAHLAASCCKIITGSLDYLNVARAIMQEEKNHAKSRDAMDEGTKFAPPGSWVQSRNWRDRYLRRD